MKVRLGFVSNSSSTAFVCRICGAVESGMEMEIEDADMVECKNGHIVCKKHVKASHLKELEEFRFSKEDDEDWDGDATMPVEHCPICTFASITDCMMLAYLLKKNGLKRASVEDEMRAAKGVML